VTTFRWVSILSMLAALGCGEFLGIDTIEYGAPPGSPATTTGGGGHGGSEPPPPETVTGRGCVSGDVCGDAGASCCESRLIPGSQLGEYRMGCSSVPGRPCSAETQGPEHQASVGDFYLDTFEVTVGRFRQFVEDYNSWKSSGNPKAGAGSHPRIPDSGWRATWDELLPKSDLWFDVALDCHAGFNSWRSDADSELAQNCLSWPLAFAFCIWSGGRLPTEAEWEIAAVGANKNWLYAWGIEAPEPKYAVYNDLDEYPPTTFWLKNVGSKAPGIGLFGQLDLCGNIGEWTLDQYSTTWFDVGGGGNPCIDCANLGDAQDTHVLRGGSWGWSADDLLSTARDDETGTLTADRFGVRCARDGAP
jgi:sulfatase modifying factor 1